MRLGQVLGEGRREWGPSCREENPRDGDGVRLEKGWGRGLMDRGVGSSCRGTSSLTFEANT